jgi:glutaredoxin
MIRTHRTSVAVAALTLGTVIFLSTANAGQVAANRPPVEAPRAGGRITVYGASWCTFCKALEKTLEERGLPFDYVDVDRNPEQYNVAKRASGANGMPLSSVVRAGEWHWIVGNQPDAVESAYRGD